MAPVTPERLASKHRVPQLFLLTLLSLTVHVCAQAQTPSPVRPATPEQAGLFDFNVAAGPLEQGLNQLGVQAGILLTFPEELIDGLRTQALVGRYSVAQALDRLLLGSGLEAFSPERGTYSIRKTRADSSTAELARLPYTLVRARRVDRDSKVLSNEEMRDAMRSDMAETLSLIPSVRIDDTASSSLQQGDLKPAEFSIRGAASYQNKLMLDGASVDNLLDPALKESASNYTRVAGHSQGLFIDTDFLGQVEVIDVNASASEGGFTGGVVKAQTRAYAGRNSANISHRGTSDSWTRFHVDDAQLGEFEDGAAQLPAGVPGDFQPDFRKKETSLDGAARVGDVGIFAGFSEKRATIRQKQLVSLDFDYFAETGRIFRPSEVRSLDSHSRFGVVRLDLLERDYVLNASLAYSDYSEDSFLINYLDSEFDSQHSGLNLSVNFATDLGPTRMDLNLNAGVTADQRDYANNVLHQYKDISIYDGAMVGGYGELESSQRNLGATLKFDRAFSQQINLAYGGEFRWLDYQQNRGNDFTANEYRRDSSQSPPPQTSPGSWAPSGQYLQTQVVYEAGELDFSSLNSALFTELAGEHRRAFWRTGIRLERDGWLKNSNFAPRLLAGLYLDADKAYRLAAGANRYYGKSFLSYRLREKERSRRTERRRSSPDEAFVLVDNSQEWRYLDLDTPYDDEYSLGLSGPLWRGQAGLQWVHRRGQKQIRTEHDAATDIDWFDNTGSSRTQQVDLYWRSNPLYGLGAHWAINTSASWMDKETDSTYSSGSGGYLSTIDGDDEVIFEGRRVKRRELPGGDFATPISANIDLLTRTFNDRIGLRNSLSYTHGYQYLRSLGRDTETGLSTYEVEEQGSALRWDMSVEYQLLRAGASPYLRVDVVNVTDNDNVVRAESGVQLFGVGRQYWLEVGYRF